MRRIDELYLEKPFYGSRRMTFDLNEEGRGVNRKRVQRLMRLMGLEGLVPRPGTSKAAPGNKIYPYLLRGVTITEPNHVWASDITYIPMANGFLYLVAIIDWASRAVLAWRLSNTMDSAFCVEALEEALQRYGKPRIFNTDQGAQFTSAAFTGKLEAAGIAISMDGRGRFMDNIFIERLWRSIKYEEVHLESLRRRPRSTGRHRPMDGFLQPSAASPGHEQPTTNERVARRHGTSASDRRKLWICRFAWTTQTRCPHTHSSDRKKRRKRLEDFFEEEENRNGRRLYTLIPTAPGPTDGVHLRLAHRIPSVPEVA